MAGARVLELSYQAQLGAGLSFGLAILTRPVTAVVPATFSPFTEAYGSGFVDQAGQRTFLSYLANLAGFFFWTENSLLLWSLFLIVLLFGLRGAWRTAPDWVRVGAVSGAVCLLVHAALNRQSGGLPHNYRYSLEMLVMAAAAADLAIGEPRCLTLLRPASCTRQRDTPDDHHPHHHRPPRRRDLRLPFRLREEPDVAERMKSCEWITDPALRVGSRYNQKAGFAGRDINSWPMSPRGPQKGTGRAHVRTSAASGGRARVQTDGY